MSAEVDEDLRDCISSLASASICPEEKSLHSNISYDYDPSLPSRPPSSLASAFDPNFDTNATYLDDDSPYPEVRSAVANYDDPSMPVSTLRAWVLGLLWAVLLPGINQFYFFRYPSLLVGSIVPQLMTFPLGRAWARWVPSVRVLGVSLNPGPFTIKEHVLVTIMAGVGAQSAYASDIVAVQRVYYRQNFGFAYQWMLVMSTQLIGFSIGGIARRLLVDPASMIWPNTLVVCALFNTLHSQSYAGIGPRDGLSRERFFTFAFVSAALWWSGDGRRTLQRQRQRKSCHHMVSADPDDVDSAALTVLSARARPPSSQRTCTRRRRASACCPRCANPILGRRAWPHRLVQAHSPGVDTSRPGPAVRGGTGKIFDARAASLDCPGGRCVPSKWAHERRGPPNVIVFGLGLGPGARGPARESARRAAIALPAPCARRPPGDFSDLRDLREHNDLCRYHRSPDVDTNRLESAVRGTAR
ncbi:hypothetical protein CERSUDRAFT_120304 [Gelatoporia subvermispora B]|uniref:Oligopeptide transporter n=1 Tax=Ceriporiopsis subvermispora (strain B) TaxID=914234 RepID=M2QXX1_CERS8|nr:hypothetical protein CERSUDRAFT_120304 [Gelatoporia subvermispora B]